MSCLSQASNSVRPKV